MRQRAYRPGLAGTGGKCGGQPPDPAWARVRREIGETARQAPEQVRRDWLSRAAELVRYHLRDSRNPAYRDLVGSTEKDVAEVTSAGALERLPVIDKHWLAAAGYDREPACAEPVMLVGTTGSTGTQVLVPVTPQCAYRGLGDNFLRALAMSGVGPRQRHWGIEHRPAGQAAGQTGSAISMTWLARHCGCNALVTVATEPLHEQLERAAEFAPDTISGSPGFLRQIARADTGLRPALLLYGGAALDGSEASELLERIPGARLTAFYPTTEAGALGVAPAGDGIYRTFTETHLIEVLDDQGTPVAVGSRGDVVVTQFDALAAPIIRYRVGDQATYLGWEGGRMLLSGIERATEAAIGSALVPLSDLRSWAPRLAACDPAVVAVQLVRRPSGDGGPERPVVRVIGGMASEVLASAARALIDDLPQVAAEITSGELGPAEVEFGAAPATLAGYWKIPLYVDERQRAQEPPCPAR